MEQKVMTDLFSDVEIADRFTEELKRVERWCDRYIYDDTKIKKVNVISSDVVITIHNNNTRNNLKANIIGYIPWVSNVTGDKWFIFVYEDLSGRRCPLNVYYWETIGSSGMMINHDLGIEEDNINRVGAITTFSSHAILRVKQRLDISNLTDFDVLTIFTGLLFSSELMIDEDEESGKKTIVLSTHLGVFRGPCPDFKTHNGHVVIRFKTFINTNGLSYKDKKFQIKSLKNRDRREKQLNFITHDHAIHAPKSFTSSNSMQRLRQSMPSIGTPEEELPSVRLRTYSLVGVRPRVYETIRPTTGSYSTQFAIPTMGRPQPWRYDKD